MLRIQSNHNHILNARDFADGIQHVLHHWAPQQRQQCLGRSHRRHRLQRIIGAHHAARSDNGIHQLAGRQQLNTPAALSSAAAAAA